MRTKDRMIRLDKEIRSLYLKIDKEKKSLSEAQLAVSEAVERKRKEHVSRVEKRNEAERIRAKEMNQQYPGIRYTPMIENPYEHYNHTYADPFSDVVTRANISAMESSLEKKINQLEKLQLLSLESPRGQQERASIQHCFK